jgi:hypothetical protein
MAVISSMKVASCLDCILLWFLFIPNLCWLMEMFTFPTFSYFLNLVAYRPQAVKATGQVLFHRFYCNKSFARFNVKIKLCSPVILSFIVETQRRREGKQRIFIFIFLLKKYVYIYIDLQGSSFILIMHPLLSQMVVLSFIELGSMFSRMSFCFQAFYLEQMNN